MVVVYVYMFIHTSLAPNLMCSTHLLVRPLTHISIILLATSVTTRELFHGISLLSVCVR